MKLSLIFCCFALSLVVSAMGQGGIADSLLRIDSVVVVGKTAVKRSNVGTRVTTIDKEILTSNKSKTLSALLMENSAIQIKSMGQGALSTASFRGTSSSHTQIMWNGVSINSPSAGNFDLSEIPVFFVDNISLQHGASAQSGGSGALGGSINFSNNSDAILKRPKFTIMSEYGSNNTITEGIGFEATYNRLTTSTRLYYQQSDNDYRYLNKVSSKDASYERRKNADYKQAGAMQELYYTLKSGDKISAIAWWQFDKRSLPQPIHVDVSRKESMRNTNVRSLLSYDGVRGNHKFKATAVYLTGGFDYSSAFKSDMGSVKNENKNNTLITKGEYSTTFGKNIDLGADISYRLDNVKSNNFSKNSIDRNTLTGRVFTLLKASRRLHFEAQAMVESVNGKAAPTYNVGMRYYAIENLLTIKATNAYNYRFPSMNDLYWQPGGNSDLKPEKGFSWDATASLTPRVGDVALTFDASVFLMNIDNWIMWIPTGNGFIWKPVNFSSVRSQGVELGGNVKFHIGKSEHKLSGNYAYTHSTDRTNRDDNTNGKQLPYMPRNRWNANYNLSYGAYWLSYNVSFTDLRFVSADQSYFTPKYMMHNAEVGGKHSFKSGRAISLTFRVDNLFDDYYESTQYYPMPLRMLNLRAIFEF